MREWLERVIPAGPLHTWAVDGARAGTRIAVALLLFALFRWLVVRGIRMVLRPLLARLENEGAGNHSRLRTLGSLAESAVTYSLLFVLVVGLLSDMGINVATLVAGAGVAGLALSFGAQRLVRDLLTGFFLLLEDQFRVGEVVTIVASAGLPQLTGTITEIGLRATRLQDISGKHITIGNGDIAAVVNHSRGPVTATVDVGVPSDTPMERLHEVVHSAELPPDLLEGTATVQGVAALDSDKMVVRITAPALPGKAPEGELALRQAIGQALRTAEITIK